MFQKLEQAGLKLKLSKCELFHRQITYLGHIVYAQGIATNKGKIDAIRKWLTPTTVTEFQSFLGFMGNYHQSIPKFVQVPQPLHNLTSDENAGKKKVPITWNDRCQQSFDDLKGLCTMAPILAHSNFMKPFKLHTNTCQSGLGAILYQTCDDETNAVIAYASRSLTKAETHYPAYNLEFLTLKWAVVKKFYDYPYGSTNDVYTNNNTLMYILMTAKLDAVSHWWVAILANYNFQLYYRAGKTNIDVDALSRVSWPRCMAKTLGTDHQVTAAVWALQKAALKGPTSPIEVDSCDLCILDLVGDGLQVACMTAGDWHQAQRADSVLSLMNVRM